MKNKGYHDIYETVPNYKSKKRMLASEQPGSRKPKIDDIDIQILLKKDKNDFFLISQISLGSTEGFL